MLAAAVLVAATGGSGVQAASDQWLNEASAACGKVTAYTAIFHKQQRVDGELLPEETIFIKWRKPFSLYMSWIEEPYKGSELLYSEGWNDNRARVHRGGILRCITRDLEPKHPRLLAGNLRPFTDTGLGYLVKSVECNVRKAVSAGEFSCYERGEESAFGRKTQRFEVVFPKDRNKGYDAYRLVIDQDPESKLLVQIRIYDWDDQLFEYYGYENLKLDAGLTDSDFDPENPDYHF